MDDPRKTHQVAFVGDVHGRLRQMYAAVDADLIVQVGDLHAIRDEEDLRHFPAPARHKQRGDFSEFINAVPLPTLAISGNHDNARWYRKHPQGAWLSNNLFYLGVAGAMDVCGLRLAWLSGVYAPSKYESSRSHAPTHFHRSDIERLSMEREVDVLVTHDWPHLESLEHAIVGDSVSDAAVLQKMRKRGSVPVSELLMALRPKYVFCGHMHVPLSLDLNLSGSTNGGNVTHLHALAPSGSPGSVYTLRSDSSKTKAPLRSLSVEDQVKLAPGFARLEEGAHGAAAEVFESVYNTGSQQLNALAAYGVGVAKLKGDTAAGALPWLRQSLAIAESADARLLHGLALQQRIKEVFIAQPAGRKKDVCMAQLAASAIDSLMRARELNPGFGKTVDEHLGRLSRLHERMRMTE